MEVVLPSFGQRIGERPVRGVIQLRELEADTRVALWNVIYAHLSSYAEDGDLDFAYDSLADDILRHHWQYALRRPADEFNPAACIRTVKSAVLSGDWVDALTALEDVGAAFEAAGPSRAGTDYREEANQVLSEELVGYRFVGFQLVEVDDDRAVEEIEVALAAASPASRGHLVKAISLLADKANPKPAKVASEAISAVEAAVFELTGKRTLGEGMSELNRRGAIVHPALTRAWSAMYGYASDSAGIRHANIKGDDIDSDLAVYLLVTCSAFVSLLAKVARRP